MNSHSLSIVLKLIAPLFVLVGVLHLALGLHAELLLGADLNREIISNPALDSQNRFYGVAFAVYGVLFYVCSRDIMKYATIIRCLLWVFCLAGISRLVSIAFWGLPPLPILLLMCLEILLPPLLLLWLRRATVEGG